MVVGFIFLTIVLAIGAYLLGSVPAAYLIARWSRGIDVRRYGSGNVGASNVLRVASKRLSIPVIIFDLGKGILPVWVAQLIGLEVYQQVVVGVAAISGHNWSIFLHFSGGRGVLTTVGVAFAFAPWLAVVLVAVAFAFLPFGKFAFGTLLAITMLPIFSWFLAEPFGISRSLTLTLGFTAILLLAIVRRLTAPKTSFTDTVPTGQLILNRILLDRDIRDRKAWITRVPAGETSVEESLEESFEESLEEPLEQQEKQG